MLMVATLDRMAKSSTRSEKPAWGRRLAARRTELGLSLGDVEAMTEGAVYTQLLYRLENGRMNPDNVKAPQLDALLTALQWSRSDWFRNLGRDEPRKHDSEAGDVPLEIPGGMFSVPIVGRANGGKPSGYGIPVRRNAVRGSNTRAFEVEGNSMAVGDRDGIRDGDFVLIDLSLTKPINGKVFLLEILGDGLTVKRLRKIEGEWLFMSDNPIGETWRDDQVRIIGQVYGKVDYTEVQ